MGKRRSGTRGSTILEVALTSSVFALVMGGVYLMAVKGKTVHAWGSAKIEVQRATRLALETMGREIRMAGYDPSAPAVIPRLASANAIQTANPSEIQFIADVDGDGITDRVTYRLAGDQVVREISSWGGDGWTPPNPNQSELADGVQALTFSYYDGNNSITGTPGNVRRVTINVAVSKAAAGKRASSPLGLDIRLRNLGL